MSPLHFIIAIDQNNLVCGLSKISMDPARDVDRSTLHVMTFLFSRGACAGVVATCFPDDCLEDAPSFHRFHRRLNCMSKALDIPILDHVFVGPNDYDADHSVFVDEN